MFNIERKGILKRILLLLIFVLCLTGSVVSFEITEIEKSWREKGYTVIEEDNLKIVELSFQFDHVLSVNESSQELYVISHLNQNTSKPDSSYTSDLEKILSNSSFSEEVIRGITNHLVNQETWENSFFAIDSLQIITMLYDQMTPVLRIIFLEKQIENQIPIENEKEDTLMELEEELRELKTEYIEIEKENKKLSMETETLTNKNVVLEKTNQNLKEDLDKFKNLSDYKDRTIHGLKNTIDRYVSIEKQKNESIEELQNKIVELNEEYSMKVVEYQNTIGNLETEIESLEMSLTKKLLEIKLIKETEQQLLERIEQLKKINDKQMEQFHAKSGLIKTKEATQNTSKQIKEEKPSLILELADIVDKNHQEDEKDTEEKLSEIEKKEEIQEENQSRYLLKEVVVYDKGEKTVAIENEYNENGDLIREHVLSPEGKSLMITEIEYNSEGNVKERITYEKSQIVMKQILQYDKQQRILRVFVYNQESLTHYSLFEYDESISQTEPIKIKYFFNNQLDSYEENDFNQEGKLINSIRKKSDGKTISQKVYKYKNDELQKIIFFQFGEKTSYQIMKYDENGLQQSQITYDAKDQIISEMILIWDEVE